MRRVAFCLARARGVSGGSCGSGRLASVRDSMIGSILLNLLTKRLA